MTKAEVAGRVSPHCGHPCQTIVSDDEDISTVVDSNNPAALPAESVVTANASASTLVWNQGSGFIP
jgi:hypothetical protein